MRSLFVVIITLLLLENLAFAATQCDSKRVTDVYAGDDGHLWIYFDSGCAYLVPTDADLKNIFALVTTAIITEKTVTIRYEQDGVNCNECPRGDVRGLFLNRN